MDIWPPNDDWRLGADAFDGQQPSFPGTASVSGRFADRATQCPVTALSPSSVQRLHGRTHSKQRQPQVVGNEQQRGRDYICISYANVNKLRAMKGDHLGAFEELTLLTVLALGEKAYGVAVQEKLERDARRAISLGAVYAALNRLEGKGLLVSAEGEATAERGGRRKRMFAITTEGRRTLRAIRATRDRIWRLIESESPK